MALKRQILTSNVFGVDLDPGAVEVTQLSLYLKMLENENRNTLQRQRELLPEDDDALLPPLENNIKCGNSLIASDFSMMPDDLVRVRAFDWEVGFKDIMKAGGFDAVFGNPPYGRLLDNPTNPYAAVHFAGCRGNPELTPTVSSNKAFGLIQAKGRSLSLCRRAGCAARAILRSVGSLPEFRDPRGFINLPFDVFADAWRGHGDFCRGKKESAHSLASDGLLPSSAAHFRQAR